MPEMQVPMSVLDLSQIQAQQAQQPQQAQPQMPIIPPIVLRMECLKMAVELADGDMAVDVLGLADNFMEYVTNPQQG